jgi:hypothetical protein
MKIVIFLSIICLLTHILGAATFSGVVENKFGQFIGFTALTATKQSTGEVVDFEGSRNGSFSVELLNGTWTITADTQQIAEWGYGPLDTYEIEIDGSDILQNIILLASEPLQTPSISFELDLEADRITYKVKGQGGTRVTLYASSNLQTWSPIMSSTVRATGSGFTSTTPNNFSSYKMFFKVVATTE